MTVRSKMYLKLLLSVAGIALVDASEDNRKHPAIDALCKFACMFYAVTTLCANVAIDGEEVDE